MTSQALIRPSPTLMRIPLELRINMYQHIYTDLIAKLSENLFGVFDFYEHIYDCTSVYLETQDGKTGLTTPLLYVCKQMYEEALPVLYAHAQFVVNIKGNERHSTFGIPHFEALFERSRHLEFVRHLKINLGCTLFPVETEPEQTHFLARIAKFLDLIQHGANLQSLEIHLDDKIGLGWVERVFTTLATLRITGNSIKVYFGFVSRKIASNGRLTLLLDAINGVSMGRRYGPLKPDYCLDAKYDEVDFCMSGDCSCHVW